MMIPMFLIALQVAGTAAPDQTSDFLTVTRFLEAVRSDDRRATSMVAGARITNPFETEKRTLADLRNETEGCRLQQLSVVANKVSSVSVDWYCPRPKPKVYGDISVKAGRIERVSFGREPRIIMTPINR